MSSTDECYGNFIFIYYIVYKVSVYSVTKNVWHVKYRANTVWLVMEVFKIIISIKS
jgi:hypothetical protein